MDFYGTDWDGHVPVCDNDDSTVVVDDLPPQRQALTDQLLPSESLTEDWMITNYTTAKVFVHQLFS